MLKLENVSKYYYSKDNVALGLHNVDVAFYVGELVAITGESGSGKSTLLNVISGLDTYEAGKMFINNMDISHYAVEELEEYRRQYIGFVFQNYNIIDSYTVLQNVEMALIIQGYDTAKRRERALELIEQVGLSHRVHARAATLSGGEKQRTVIARALAKDSAILVCDEPTGNLDTTSTMKIFELLKQISEHKLVIVVTHNYGAIKPYATRVIRMYDGEIVEDSTIENFTNEKLDISLKPFHTSLLETIKIAFNNIISVPRKTAFTFLVTLFIITSFVFSYGSNLKQYNTSEVYETPYFENSNPSRLIITKYTDEAFTQEEIDELMTIEYVRDVILYDYTLDTSLTSKYHNDIYGFDEFVTFKVFAAISLNEFDLLEGTLPKDSTEIVMAKNDYYEIGDEIELSNSVHVKEREDFETDDYQFTVVGLVDRNMNINDDDMAIYFTTDAIESFRFDANYEYNQRYILLNNEIEYTMYQEIRIDNNLEDYVFLGYDAMFFEMCQDLGLEECIPADFVSSNQFSVSSISVFEPKKIQVPVIFTTVPFVDNTYGQAIYVNQHTYNTLMSDDVYQPSLVVYDMFEATKIIDDLEELGYNVFYPHGILTVEQGLRQILRNVQLFISLTFTMIVVYFIGYFVMRNVMLSKRKDYIIYRSVGASKSTINTISILEIMMISLVSFVLLMTFLLVNEQYKSPIPQLLRYFEIHNYIILLTTIFAVMYLMGRRFNKKIYNQSVISSLRELSL